MLLPPRIPNCRGHAFQPNAVLGNRILSGPSTLSILCLRLMHAECPTVVVNMSRGSSPSEVNYCLSPQSRPALELTSLVSSVPGALSPGIKRPWRKAGHSPPTAPYRDNFALTYHKKKLHGLSPRANCTDRATAACRRSYCQLFADRGCHVVSVTDAYGRILGFLDRSRYFSYQVAPQLYSRG
jgi:hypothetical protein